MSIRVKRWIKVLLLLGIVGCGLLAVRGEKSYADVSPKATTNPTATGTPKPTATPIPLSPTVITAGSGVSDASQISGKTARTYFWLDRDMYMIYNLKSAPTSKVSMNYSITDSTGKQVASWTAESAAGTSYRSSYYKLSSSKFSNGGKYTLTVTATADGYNINAAKTSFSTYTKMKLDYSITEEYIVSGETKTLSITPSLGTGSYTYQWGYGSSQIIEKWSEVTPIEGETKSTCTVTANATNNSRYFFVVVYDDAEGFYITQGWSVREKYEIKYNDNYQGDIAGATDMVDYDKTSSFVVDARIPKREGYVFKGWSTSATAAEPELQPGDSYVPTGSTTLYAVWSFDTILNAQPEISIIYGKQLNIISEAQVQSFSGAKYSFKSKNTSIIQVVGSSGQIKAKGYGNTYVTVAVAGDSKHESISTKIKVRVKPPKVKGVKISKKGVLSWKKVKGSGVKYIVYCKKKGSKSFATLDTKTKKTKKKVGTNIKGYKFYVTAYAKGNESEASKVVKVK